MGFFTCFGLKMVHSYNHFGLKLGMVKRFLEETQGGLQKRDLPRSENGYGFLPILV